MSGCNCPFLLCLAVDCVVAICALVLVGHLRAPLRATQDGLHAGQIAEREANVELVRYFRSRGLVRLLDLRVHLCFISFK